MGPWVLWFGPYRVVRWGVVVTRSWFHEKRPCMDEDRLNPKTIYTHRVSNSRVEYALDTEDSPAASTDPAVVASEIGTSN